MKEQRSRSAKRVRTTSRFTFADVFDAHVDEVYRFVHRRCRDHSLAEDITQETFMAAIRNFNDPSEVSVGWLMTVARNCMLDVLRRQSNYATKLQLVGTPKLWLDDDRLAERLWVEAALNELSVDYRLVLTLHYVDGYTVPALAEHLGRSAKSVEGLITRARRELRKRLDEDGGQMADGGAHV